jgi:MurNAc alpha-1-phosphate uridylyltransferase
MMPQSAMVMAAGFGTRMRPLSLDRPKPLLMLGDRTILDHTLDRLVEAGILRIVINTHYLAEMIHTHMAAPGKPAVIFSDESTVLETGGGIRQALPLLSDPFFTANADTVWRDGPGNGPSVTRLAKAWDSGRMDALLLLTPTPEGHPGDYTLQPDQRLVFRGKESGAPYMYAGLNILKQELVAVGPEGAFSQKLLWDAAEKNGRLYGLVHEGAWYNIGTPDELAAANATFR